jgi:hypothetical protein
LLRTSADAYAADLPLSDPRAAPLNRYVCARGACFDRWWRPMRSPQRQRSVDPGAEVRRPRRGLRRANGMCRVFQRAPTPRTAVSLREMAAVLDAYL